MDARLNQAIRTQQIAAYTQQMAAQAASLKNADAAVADAAVADAAVADPTSCGLLAGEYQRQAIFANLFTAVWFFLVAMTALVLVSSLALLVWLLLTLQGDTVTANVIKLIGTVGTAVGTIITGVAAVRVKDASDAQNDRAKDAAQAASTACGQKVGG